MVPYSNLYQIVRQKSFDEQIRNLCDSFSRMNELDLAIDWALMRFNKEELSADITEMRRDYYLWILPTYTLSTIPQVRIVFHVNEVAKKVTLIEISEE